LTALKTKRENGVRRERDHDHGDDHGLLPTSDDGLCVFMRFGYLIFNKFQLIAFFVFYLILL
jgi:hypothetical protein